jgi:hypothetical protein
MPGKQAHCEAANDCVEQRMTMASTGRSKDLLWPVPKDSRSASPSSNRYVRAPSAFHSRSEASILHAVDTMRERESSAGEPGEPGK